MPPSGKRKKITFSARTSKKKKDLYDDPEELLISSDSPLYQEGTSIKYILQHPLAIATLAESEMGYQFESLSSQELDTRATEVKKDGSGGCYDPQWIREALSASSNRSAGLFDDYLEDKFQEYWAEEDGNEFISDDEDEGDSKSHGSKLEDENRDHTSPVLPLASVDSIVADAQDHAQSQDVASTNNGVLDSGTTDITPQIASLTTYDEASKVQNTLPPNETVSQVAIEATTAPQNIINAEDCLNINLEMKEAKTQEVDENDDRDHKMTGADARICG